MQHSALFSKLRAKPEQSPALSKSSCTQPPSLPTLSLGKAFAQMHRTRACIWLHYLHHKHFRADRDLVLSIQCSGCCTDKHQHWQRLCNIKCLCWQHHRAWELPYLVHQHYLMTCHWGCALLSSACNTPWKGVSLTLPGCKETPSVLPSPFPTAIKTKKDFSLYTCIEQVKTWGEKTGSEEKTNSLDSGFCWLICTDVCFTVSSKLWSKQNIFAPIEIFIMYIWVTQEYLKCKLL